MPHVCPSLEELVGGAWVRNQAEAAPVREEAPWPGTAPGAPGLGGLLAPARGPGELGWLGPYRVLGVLGAGGMGVVLGAEDPQLRRRLALKVMRPDLAADVSVRR